MLKHNWLWLTFAGILTCCANVIAEQRELIRLPATQLAERSQSIFAPTADRLQEESYFPEIPDEPLLKSAIREEPPLDLKSLMRPRYNLSFDWESEVDGLEMNSFELSVRMPTYPIFGPPPPMITGGYSLTQINSPISYDLPSNLHEFTLGMGWMRRINEQWMARFMLSSAFASDLDNTGIDAWQVRAGGFAMYRPNERWTFAFGALVTGRDDLPVIPAVGAIWEPSPEIKVNLMMPIPRVSMLLRETGSKQHWGYLGGSIAGGTWAYERATAGKDRLSYGEFRLVVGWESKPPQPPGTYRPTGRTLSVEIGYVFGREFEFDSASPDISIGDTMVIRTEMSF